MEAVPGALRCASVLVLVVLAATTAFAKPASVDAAPFPVPVYFFWGDGCAYCAKQKVFLEQLVADHPNVVVRAYEVYDVPENRPLMAALAAAFGRPVTGVPMTFIGDEVWVGFTDANGRQMRDAVARYETYAAPDPVDRLDPELRVQFVPTPAPAAPPPPSGTAGAAVIEVPLLGAIDVGSRALWVSTALIALVDGFNPCSLWVMALLLAVVVNTRSRRRVVLVGVTFLVVAAAVYGLFIAGLFSIFSYVAFLDGIRVLVALLALGFALINLKDYFAYKRVISLTIDDAQKPGIYKRIRGVMNARASLPATLAATGGMAVGVTLVELPCTAGLPVLWTTLLADAGVGAVAFVLLLALYMLIFLLDELVIFGVVVVTMRAARIEEREGRVLKLVGGAVMFALALVMLIRPALLESIGGTVAVFGVASGAALVVLLLHRFLFPASSPWAPAKGAGKTG